MVIFFLSFLLFADSNGHHGHNIGRMMYGTACQKRFAHSLTRTHAIAHKTENQHNSVKSPTSFWKAKPNSADSTFSPLPSALRPCKESETLLVLGRWCDVAGALPCTRIACMRDASHTEYPTLAVK